MVAPVVLHQFQFNKNVNFAILVLVFPLSHFKALDFVFKKRRNTHPTTKCSLCPHINDPPGTEL